MNRPLAVAADSAVGLAVDLAAVADALADRAIVSVADADKKTKKDAVTSNGSEDNQDLQQLQELYDLMRVENLESLELESSDGKIRLQRARRGGSVTHDSHSMRVAHPTSQESSNESAASEASNGQTIPTPLAGVFYRSSSPTNPPYVQEGATVEIGQTLCIVEAMKVMNEIKAETRCKITKIMAENARPVTAGQTLFLVEPA